MTDSNYHVPIMLGETMELLKPARGGVFVDGTLGGGGHAKAVLERLPEGSRLIGIDRDADAIAEAEKRLQRFQNAFTAVHGNFFQMKSLLNGLSVDRVSGILLDLGVSSHQLDEGKRGFSYHADAPLDMRMDASAPFRACDVVNGYSFEELARVIREYGEERYAGRIASAILREREKHSLDSTSELADIIKGAIPAATRREGPHPARRTFQALRIEVNGELEGLRRALDDAEGLLEKDGVLTVITFHSLEDRIVKQAFRDYENPCTCDPRAPMCTCNKLPTSRILTKKPLIASEEEVNKNPRSRSAKLRAVQKL